MAKKGWWRQLQSDDYPETHTNYGQDMRALRKPVDNRKPQPSPNQKLREPAKPIYDPEYITRQKRSTKPSASLDLITLPAPRKKKRYKTKRRYQRQHSCNQLSLPTIYCKKCGHEKPISKEKLLEVRVNLKRFVCTKCGSRSPGIRSSKERART